ncbi:tubulin-tyrosine ligase family-domain-containing protein [Kockovaella imperatae]|uniref:Tubulin-tyrosine ligase family-domain-containing protein n=1 Tax=Kockovaella imperatae TaxID=4999 RepID=A0A1Y1UHQ7_9TREE|nr:tubulin-tyrosine ligase family-domain-containing protein [Kockovaella imperatae]ORX37578.1 tubulin-tyrosine ligase family-domain-containing protein [Kockovaella imperatae]
MTESEAAATSRKDVLKAFVSFPSPYTQTLILQALVSTCPEIAISLVQPTEDNVPALQWADYDLLEFEKPRSNPSSYLISSYIYRKALIRKHQLHRVVLEYLAKCDYRQTPSTLQHAWPKGWDVEVQHADDLDELWIDDLYELAVVLDENEAKGEEEKRWFIFKPGFADRAQGIRLFSTKQELEDIFSAFDNPDSEDEEPDQISKYQSMSQAADATVAAMASREPRDDTFDEKLERWKRRIEESSDEEDEEDELKREPAPKLMESGETTGQEEGPVDGVGKLDLNGREAMRPGKAAEQTKNGRVTSDGDQDEGEDERDEDDEDNEEDDDDDDDDDEGIVTSQLRHFLLQEYIPSPILFDIAQEPNVPSTDPTGYKFHLRAYVLVTGAYTVHVSRTVLALFSGSPYVHPTSSNLNLQAHLTNTCLQTDAFGALAPPEELIKLYWDLDGMSALNRTNGDYGNMGKVDKQWLEDTFERVGEVISESVKAGAECGSFNLQFMPNAFEIFGVDLLLSFPPSWKTTQPDDRLPTPSITLLEFNASPDFHQSGMNLRPRLLELFKGVVEIAIKPFFGENGQRSSDDSITATTEGLHGWHLVGHRDQPRM